MRVEEREVVGDDGKSQGLEEDAHHAAGRAHDVADRRDRADVAVAHRRHGDDGPPEAHRDGVELIRGLRGVLALGVVDHGGEDEHGDEEEDEEHHQLLKAGPEGVDKHF